MYYQEDNKITSTNHVAALQKLGGAVAVLFFVFFIATGHSHAQEDASFRPTWKLLSFERKQQFIAGYLQGWRDAARVTDIAITYIRKNPQQAIESLEGIRELYKLRSVDSTILVEAIDDFYDDPVNSEAPLSRAVTAARARIQ